MKKIVFRFVRGATFNYSILNKPNRLYVLLFHQVNDLKRIFYPGVPIKAFHDTCKYLAKHFAVIHPSEIDEHFRNTSRPAVIISFDDGHYDIVNNALPILLKYKLKFNINIDTEILETGLPQDFVRVYDILNQSDADVYSSPLLQNGPIRINRTNPIITENAFTAVLSVLPPPARREFVLEMDRSMQMDKLRYSRMMSEADVTSLSNYDIEFGSHTHTHPILKNLSDQTVGYEMRMSKEKLEKLTGKPVPTFAFPNGVWDERTLKHAQKAGYTHIFQTGDLANAMPIRSVPYYRFNLYHSSADEIISCMFGVHNFLRSVRSRLPI